MIFKSSIQLPCRTRQNIRIVFSLLLATFFATGYAQQDLYTINGVQDERPGRYLLTNAKIHTEPGKVIEGDLLIENGMISAVGSNLTVPAGTRVRNLEGKHIYPSFIDLYSDYGLSKVEASRGQRGGPEQLTPTTPGPFSQHDAIKSQYKAVEDFTIQDDQAKGYRMMGFGSVLSNKRDGLARGSSALVTLNDDQVHEVILNPEAAAHYSFNRGTSRQNYPVSQMGYMALLRQTYLDAQWYQAGGNKNYKDESLEEWIGLQDLPQVFDAPGWVQILRADKLGDEFGKQYIIRGMGDEYQRIEELKATKAPLIIPVSYPDAYDVDDPYDAHTVALAEMKHWELAPTNLSKVAAADIPFAITSEGTIKSKKFLTNLRQAVKHGLSEEDALAALTTSPATWLGMEDVLGSLNKGMIANFLITSAPIFAEDASIYENWVQGKPFIVEEMDALDLSGKYTLTVGDMSYPLSITGKPGKQKWELMPNDSITIPINASVKMKTLTLTFSPDKDSKDRIRLSGWVDSDGDKRQLKGQGQEPDGSWISWSASYIEAIEDKSPKKKDRDEEDELMLGDITYPFLPFGRQDRIPEMGIYLFKNATVWTNESEGILENADVLVIDGKIAEVGTNIRNNKAEVIDGTGLHLTSGVIDEHSHIALSSVNDRATNSSMVRMEDVVESDDINIYRQIAGGVTAAQLLHGSANPIGGQSAIVKLRWGAAPEDMLIEGADSYIKFALGENVKRSRSSNSIRYPQTRMGVEQVYVDAFTRAKAYDEAWKAYNDLSATEKENTLAPRRDLALETLAEILNSERFITCHSYVQSEINMLMHVAEAFGFNVNTFTHILEGYKVADKMAEHGVGGATFSDWWAYKFEVRYAIPYNAALMYMAGVTTSINSDDAEMARRLNQEAAKAVKYGGVPEEDAWKMVTLNPAKLLHLDDRMGSIKAGKDADLVLWSDHPLSIYAQAEKTMIDGRLYYDRSKNEEKEQAVAYERARLIQKMQHAKKSGASTQRPSRTLQQVYHCEDVGFGHDAH